ncbi:MAG: hypothetical protein U5K69_13610 [Balneolaceae bacterium]|nr:hypothetical protein [Balneolaceae bacterium]
MQEFLIGLLEHLRNLYVAKNSEKMHLVEASEDMKKRYKGASGPFTQDDLMRMMHLVSEAQFKIKDANQPRIQFEITLLKLIHMERTQNLDKLLSELEALKKKLSSAEGSDQLAKRSESADLVGKKDRQETGEETEEQKETDGFQPQENFDSESAANFVSEPGQDSGSQPKKEPAEEKQAEIPEAFNVDEEERESGEEPAIESPSPIPAEKENIKSPVSENDSTEQQQEKDEDVAVAEQPSSDFFGQPSLGNGRFSKQQSKANGKNKAGIQSQAQETTKSPKQETPRKRKNKITLEEVKDDWDTYLKELKAEIQQTLYFQMMRIEPVKVKNRELTLRCSNDFAKRIVDENKKELAKSLESVTGIFLRFNTQVHQTEQETEETKSPYERFRDLQKRDPKIKMLVELFGAELDYNLNR